MKRALLYNSFFRLKARNVGIAILISTLTLLGSCVDSRTPNGNGSQPDTASDFDIATVPNTISIAIGSNGSTLLAITPLNGFSGSVSLGLELRDGNPAPAGISVSPTSIGVSGAVVNQPLTVRVDGSVRTGTYLLRVVGTSGDISHEAELKVVVSAAPQPDFSLEISPSGLDIEQGSSQPANLKITPLNGFSGSVSLGLELRDGNPAPAGISVSPTSIGVSGAVVNQPLTVRVDGSVRTGTYLLRVVGTSGDISHEAELKVVVSAARISSIWAGGYSSFVTKSNGELWAFGANGSGQLGVGDTSDRHSPTLVLAGVGSVSSGNEHTLIVKIDKTLWATGSNWAGALGTGDGIDHAAPAGVLSDVTNSEAGEYHFSFALKNDSSLWAFGNNSYGQLGTGDTDNRPTPVRVMVDVVQVSAGYSHTLFVKSDGTLWAVGNNRHGQLGTGGTTEYHLPTQVMSDVVSAAASFRHSFAIKRDGTLWAFGQNNRGQLGTGTEGTDQLEPAMIMSGVSKVAAGRYHTLVLKQDGSLWVFGEGSSGQLGTGSTTDELSPVRIMGGVIDIAAGYYHSLVLKADGTLWGFGHNTDGELGTGDTVNHNSPYPINVP